MADPGLALWPLFLVFSAQDVPPEAGEAPIADAQEAQDIAPASLYGGPAIPLVRDEEDAVRYRCTNAKYLDGAHIVLVSQQNPDNAELSPPQIPGDGGSIGQTIPLVRVAHDRRTARYEDDDITFDVKGKKGTLNFMGFRFACKRQKGAA